MTTKPQALQNIKHKLFNPKYLNISEMKRSKPPSYPSKKNQPIIKLESEHPPNFQMPFGMMRPQFNLPQGFPPFGMHPFQMMRKFLGPNFPGNFGFNTHAQNRMHYLEYCSRSKNYHQHQPFYKNNFSVIVRKL